MPKCVCEKVFTTSQKSQLVIWNTQNISSMMHTEIYKCTYTHTYVHMRKHIHTYMAQRLNVVRARNVPNRLSKNELDFC